jgi:hypothetical protein
VISGQPFDCRHPRHGHNLWRHLEIAMAHSRPMPVLLSRVRSAASPYVQVSVGVACILPRLRDADTYHRGVKVSERARQAGTATLSEPEWARFVVDPSPRVRRVVAARTDAPDWVLECLAGDRDRQTRQAGSTDMPGA